MIRETPSELLTPAEIARWLRIRPSTVYAWAATRKIPSVRLNNTVRFVRTDIQRWLNDCSNSMADSHPLIPHPIIPSTPTAMSHQSIKEAGARAIRHVTNRKLLQRNPRGETPFLSDNTEERKDRA
jgi:excisionase family DNA binding protein